MSGEDDTQNTMINSDYLGSYNIGDEDDFEEDDDGNIDIINNDVNIVNANGGPGRGVVTSAVPVPPPHFSAQPPILAKQPLPLPAQITAPSDHPPTLPNAWWDGVIASKVQAEVQAELSKWNTRVVPGRSDAIGTLSRIETEGNSNSSLVVLVTVPVTVSSDGNTMQATTDLPTLPKKMLDKIKQGEYVDLNKIYALITNSYEESEGEKTTYTVAVKENLKDDQQHVKITPSASDKLKVIDLESWFLAWSAFLETFVYYHPHLTQDLLRYQAHIAMYATLYKVSAWLQYDKSFRNKVTSYPQMSWAKEDSRLFIAHLRGNELPSKNMDRVSSSGKRIISLGGKIKCEYCNKYGHVEKDCFTKKATYKRQNVPLSTGLGVGAHKKSGVTTQFCWHYDKGDCQYENCKFPHVCSKCGGQHPGLGCQVKS